MLKIYFSLLVLLNNCFFALLYRGSVNEVGLPLSEGGGSIQLYRLVSYTISNIYAEDHPHLKGGGSNFIYWISVINFVCN